MYVYIIICLAMLIAGVSLLVHTIKRVKSPLFQMFYGVISIGLIACAVGVFLAFPH